MISGKLRVNLLRSFIVIYVGISFLVGYFMYSNLISSQYEADTIVGNTYIGGLESDDASKAIFLSFAEWRGQAKYYLELDNKQELLDFNEINYNHDSTLGLIVEGSTTPISASFDDAYIENVIIEHWGNSLLSNVDIDMLLSDINEASENMKFYKVFPLNEYIISNEAYEVLYSESFNLDNATILYNRLETDGLISLEIVAKERWSFINTFTDYSGNYTLGELSTIASMINKLTVNYNFVGYKKYNSNDIPANQFLGYDCVISFTQQKDLSFYSPSSYPLYIEFELTDTNEITVSLKGLNIGNTYNVIDENYIVLLHELNHDIDDEFGINGAIIEITRSVYDAENNLLEETFLYEDFYPPYDLPTE